MGEAAGDAEGAPSTARSRTFRLGVIVPCRNEAEVVERKLVNLARLDWPAGGGHRIVVVDDASTDGTAERARKVARFLGGVGPALEVIANPGPAGKASAVAAALDVLGTSVDLILLTDADVILRERTPVAFAEAFEAPDVAMASGAQEFVADLADDGTCRGADGGEPRPAGDRYDRITAAVRRYESRSGRVFSVHGQALCWRRELDLRPPRGFVADDIDLMLQARAAGGRVVLADGARFLEPKVRGGELRASQTRRRAAGYFHLVRHTAHPLKGTALDSLQWLCYRYLPGAVPWAVPALSLMLPALVWIVAGAPFGLALAALIAIGWLSPVGRDLARLLAVIARGSREERAVGVSDSWEMARS